MKLCLFIAAVLVLSLSSSGCKSRSKEHADTTTPALTPQETLAQQAIDLLNQATELMKSVRDRTTADEVAPKLKTIARQLLDLNRRGVPLGSQVRENSQALGR